MHEHPDPELFYEEIPGLADGWFPIEPQQELDVYIEYWADAPLDHSRAFFEVHYTDSFITSLDLCASFSGTKLRICTPEINFGVVKSFSTAEQEFEIENFSDVDAEILTRCSKHRTFDMQSRKG